MLNQFKLTDFVSRYSENIGGLISAGGSTVFSAGLSTTGMEVTAAFWLAEAVLFLRGNTRWGYSTGCAALAVGDALAPFSEVAHGNPSFQYALMGMAATLTLGALRAPLASLGDAIHSPRLVKIADVLQPISSTLTVVQRAPGMATAVLGGNMLGAAAVTCWGAADIMMGRLQKTACNLYNYARPKMTL